MTLRINNNRLKESLFVALYSSVGLGLIFNNTSDNQATHCILSLQSPIQAMIPFLHPSIVERDNQELFHAFTFLEGWCERLDVLGNILVRNRDQGGVITQPGVGGVFNDNFGFAMRGG
jgi:hypothetical protein